MTQDEMLQAVSERRDSEPNSGDLLYWACCQFTPDGELWSHPHRNGAMPNQQMHDIFKLGGNARVARIRPDGTIWWVSW